MSRWPLLVVLLLPLGCAAPPEAPEQLAVRADQFEAAFDATLVVARDHGLTPGFRDRRAGIIETEPSPAPTILEPWITDGTGLDQRGQFTIGQYRRRARFEFEPAAGSRAVDPSDVTLIEDAVVLRGPDVLDITGDPPDLALGMAPTVLRVRVYLEQAHTPGARRDTWTRRAATRSEIRSVVAGDAPPQGRSWTPVERDRDFEGRLLAAIAAAIEDPAADGATP
jgi:hypothetical protein